MSRIPHFDTHELRTDPLPFEQVWIRNKTYEVRKADRDFKLQDVVELREYDRDAKQYSGRWVTSEIVCITRGGDYGLPEDLCVLGIREISRGPTSRRVA